MALLSVLSVCEAQHAMTLLILCAVCTDSTITSKIRRGCHTCHPKTQPPLLSISILAAGLEKNCLQLPSNASNKVE